MVRPTEPLIMFLRINCDGRTTEMEAVVTVAVVGDTLEHMTVIRGVAAVMVDIMRNILQGKSI